MASRRLPLILAMKIESAGGRPTVPLEIRKLIREMSIANHAQSIATGAFFVAQSWADCITNIAGSGLRREHGSALTTPARNDSPIQLQGRRCSRDQEFVIRIYFPSSMSLCSRPDCGARRVRSWAWSRVRHHQTKCKKLMIFFSDIQ